MTVKERNDLKSQFGMPSTKVLLPSNDAFDTKSLTSGNPKHARNNKLGGAQHDLELHPGIVSNLEIDWANQSTQFQEFIDKKSRGDEHCFGFKKKKEHLKLMN